MKPDNFRNEKNKINSWLNGIFFQDFYNAKSLILVDLSNDNIFISKRENEQQLPASLAKLFVIEYAATLADLDSIVPANYEAIQLTKPGSSVANIDAKKYFLHNLFAAILVQSGNDAAYVVADYCGSILSPQAKNSQERINVFMEHLNNYLQNQGYENTILYDPSGYDVNALTTVSDLKSVSTHLLEKQWFRDIVSKSNYTATALYNLLYARVEFGHHLGTIYGKSTMKTEGKRNADNSQKRSVHAGFRRFPIP